MKILIWTKRPTNGYVWFVSESTKTRGMHEDTLRRFMLTPTKANVLFVKNGLIMKDTKTIMLQDSAKTWMPDRVVCVTDIFLFSHYLFSLFLAPAGALTMRGNHLPLPNLTLPYLSKATVKIRRNPMPPNRPGPNFNLLRFYTTIGL